MGVNRLERHLLSRRMVCGGKLSAVTSDETCLLAYTTKMLLRTPLLGSSRSGK